MNRTNYLIYKIINKINNKMYIGQTKDSIKSRWYGHCKKNSACRALRNAIAKYGKNNFTIEKIDEAYTKEELDNKEIYWINYYNSTDKNIGYNIAKGGKVTAKLKPVICLDTNKRYDSILDCASDMGLNKKMISEVCNGRKGSNRGYRFAFLDKDGNPELDKLKPKFIIKKVMCIETGIIYNSCLKASKELCLSRNAVSEVAYGRTPTAGGYHWSFIDDNGKPTISKETLNRRRFKTKVKCIETGIVYNSQKEACDKLNIYQGIIRQAIRKGCRGGGYHWEYYKEVA